MSETLVAPDDATALPMIRVAPFPRERFLSWCKSLKIQTKDFGLKPFELLGTQRYVLDEVEKGLNEGVTTFVILKARQLGITTVLIALDLFWAFEYPGLSGCFATHTDQSKAGFRNVIKVFFGNLPKSHRVRIDRENRDMLVLQNGSMFMYLVAGVKEKEVGSLGRSGAFNFKHGTEVAFWGSEDDKKELAATMSTHYPHRLQIDESTANGFNHFYDQWTAAKSSPVQRAIFVGWWRDELYAFQDNHPWFKVYMPEGHETPLAPMERKRKKLVREQYGIDIGHNQIAWYRWKLTEEVDNDQSKMDEMFPWVEDDAFQATGSKFFLNDALTDSMREAKSKPLLPFRYLIKDSWREMAVVPAQLKQAELKIWEEAVPHGVYAIGCDPAYGSSDDADSTVIHVARCYADKIVQAAEYSSPRTSTYQCAWILAHLCGYYQNCMVNLEITGPGSVVFDALKMLQTEVRQAPPPGKGEPDLRNIFGHMRHYLYRKPDNIGGGGLAYQWRTTHETKWILMNGFKDAFELRQHVINSLRCLEEMKSIILTDGQIHGEGRKKDDRVIAAALAHEAWRRWIKQRLFSAGLTYAKVAADTQTGGPTVAEKMAIDYLRKAKIILPGQNVGGA